MKKSHLAETVAFYALFYLIVVPALALGVIGGFALRCLSPGRRSKPEPASDHQGERNPT